MKNTHQNEHCVSITKTCKHCHKEYLICVKDMTTVPLWKFENCSKLCAKANSEERLLSVGDKPLQRQAC